MANNSEIYSIQKLIYIDKDYNKAVNRILSSEFSKELNYQSLLGLAYFYEFNFKESAKIFEKTQEYYKLGYCKLLEEKTEEALLIWKGTPASPAQNWGIFFCELFTPNITTTPTYLQIRAFLERDLNLFLKVNIVNYIQKIIDISEFLFEINPETNKFIAKAFLYNDYYDYAKEYFNRALDYTEQDAELFYLSGLYDIAMNNISDAKCHLRKALRVNENYFPAKNILLKLS